MPPLARALLASIPDTVSLVVDRDYMVVLAEGDAFAPIGRPASFYDGRSIREMASPEHAEQILACYARAFAGESFVQEFQIRGHVILSSFAPHQTDYVICVARDVTAERVARQRLEERVWHDPLTGARTRAGLEDWVTNAFLRRSPFALVYLDLDNVKRVNDERGHDEGDVLLRRAVHAMASHVRREDRVVRDHGDEFIVVMKKAPNDLVARLRAVVTAAVETHGAGCSVGLTTRQPGKHESLEPLIREAELSMYEEKNARKVAR